MEQEGPEMPDELGDYQLMEEIGRGGQGVVYRARQKSLNRIVALKVIGLGQWATKAHIKRFRLEAEAAASLDHPCIVPIHEIGESDGSCYFSMKLVEGGQLDEVIKREPMSSRQAAELIVKLARTVHYAHQRGILHRDIKPGNILIDAKGEPHLTDFGLARLVETREHGDPHMAEALGTPSYMAPEQAAGDDCTAHKCDRCLRAWRRVSTTSYSAIPFRWRNDLRNYPAGSGNRAATAASVKSESGSRSFHDLPEMSRERSTAPLLLRSGAGRRP